MDSPNELDSICCSGKIEDSQPLFIILYFIYLPILMFFSIRSCSSIMRSLSIAIALLCVCSKSSVEFIIILY